MLFRARNQPYGIKPDPSLGWGRLCSDLEILNIPGMHATMLVEHPYCLSQLAPALAGALPVA